MLAPVVMPRLGLEVEQAVVAAVLVEVGTRVARGEPVLELETDKADTELVAPIDGYVRAIDVAVGDRVRIGATLLCLAETPEEPLDGSDPDYTPAASGLADAAPPRTRVAPASERPSGGVLTAPAARTLAERAGLDLETVQGTGPRGRITVADVQRAQSEGRKLCPDCGPATVATVATVRSPGPA